MAAARALVAYAGRGARDSEKVIAGGVTVELACLRKSRSA